MFAALLVAGMQGIGSGYVFLEPPRNFDAMFAWASISHQFDWSRPSPNNEACYVLLSLLDSTPCLVLFLVFPFVGVVPIETRHSTGLSGFIFLLFEYACLISCHCFCCSHSVSLLSLFLALFIVFLEKKTLGQIWLC